MRSPCTNSGKTKLNRFRVGFRPLVIGQIIQIICGALLAVCRRGVSGSTISASRT